MKYRLMRRDDNLNIFEVGPPYQSREEAEQRQREFEKGKPHGQFYWIEEVKEKTDQTSASNGS